MSMSYLTQKQLLSSYKWFASYFCPWLDFMWIFPVAMAIQHGGHFKLWRHVFPSKINACVISFKSYVGREGHLYDTSYLKTGVKGCSKIRRILAKSRLILDEMCCLYRKFASYSRHVLCKTWLIFPRINGLLSSYVPQILLQIEICSALNLSTSLLGNMPIVLSHTLLCVSTLFYYGTIAINTRIVSNYL